MKVRQQIASIVCLLALAPVTAYAADSTTTKQTNQTSQSTTDQIAADAQDALITTKVKALFALEDDIKSFDLHVSTTNHVVFISGNVDTQLQGNKAVELAQSVSGVTDVNREGLTVTSSDSYINDAFTTAKVKGKILQMSATGSISSKNSLHVETTNGVVHIFGKVGNRKDIDTLTKAVSQMSGVKEVNTNITAAK